MSKNFRIMDVAPATVIADNDRTYLRAEHGKSTEMVLCPFCNTKTMAYTWSISGGGKKCDTCPNTLHMATCSAKRFKTPEQAEAYLEEAIAGESNE